MSYSEDQTSPAAPFSGDGTGQIFETPDMIAGSPTTSERVVDTQSGFLVVVKKLGDRLALSVKRNVGTPPSSSVSLTPDESLKLSRILSTGFSPAEEEESEEEEVRPRRRGSRLFDKERERTTESDLVVPDSTPSSVHVPMKLMLASVLRAFMVPILGVALSVFALGIGAGITGMNLTAKPQAAVPAIVDPLDRVKVDTFVRDYTAKLLDFTSKTYRISQVQAMAAMSPELLERYWQESRFPMSRRQLAGRPQSSSVMISQMKQERLDANNMQVAVHAELIDPANPKVSTPVNLSLKVSVDRNGQLFVSDQQDLSSK